MIASIARIFESYFRVFVHPVTFAPQNVEHSAEVKTNSYL